MMKKTLILVTMASGLSLTSSISLGQLGLIPGANDPSKADLRVMTENRSLVSTRIDPFKGQAEGYVVGEDEGSFDLNDLRIFMAQLRGEIKSVFSQRPPEGNQVKMVVTTYAPVRPVSRSHKGRIKRAQSKNYQQKI